MFDPDGPTDVGKALLWAIKWGGIAWICALIFNACTGQLPSDPG